MIITINALKVAETFTQVDVDQAKKQGELDEETERNIREASFDFFFEILTNANIDGWYLTEKLKPEAALEVLGYHEKWIDKDYNPDGICVCFMQDDKVWFMAKWCNDHDEWRTVECENSYKEMIEPTPNPTHWRPKPITPTQ